MTKIDEIEKFYLRIPSCFSDDGDFLNYNKWNDWYFLGDKGYMDNQTQFTKAEINAMPFDTNFFEKVKVEQADE